MALVESIVPRGKMATSVRWNIMLPILLALAAFVGGGVLRLRSDQHVTRYVSPAGITTVIVESATARFGSAFDCSSVHPAR